ncbi:surface protease GP63, putative [Trypanosoma cruzi]|uniref:Leishmanolysin-like peptidase n=1 Tax=Trypanosoma cruzi (strain CL Brener) TaxID=353153 RepID=Q4DL97_TRYCC|nr:surface protease GP63, putative [Trypanosoma cruzi]EAN93302.1 surface protease GP63, putative [Trypanosoma cruzi]|eukprot:XP_815153.1 surface protease GP63 [Trypanosoma cruzi strain CL Brener]
MHISQAMRQPRHATPPLPLLVLLLMCCATACIAATPATQYRRGLDEMMRSGPLSTAVVREVPRKGQGTMQAYTVATQDDNSGWEPIRIEVFTDGLKSTRRKETYCQRVGVECDNLLGEQITCKEEHVLSEAKKQLYTEKILPGAVKLHSERLLVKPTGRNITVPNTLNEPCNHFTLPVEHRRYGVAADFIIYAFAGPSGTKSRVVWAATCNKWEDLRPSIGAMNFDPKYMTDTAWSVRVAAHEIAHALGFSKESMDEKSILKNSANIVRDKVRRMVAGDHVQAKAKAHFGCETLEGMELEDEGGTREKAIPHWKGRHARDELMAPTVGAGYYTALTMAVFADMGYYSVNWSMAEPMGWGNSTGCDFLEKNCNATENLAGKYPHMFCNDSDKETLRCTSDRRHVGTCTATIVENEGSLAEKDLCPVVSSYFHEKSSGIKYRTCSDENVDYLPGSLTGGDSWCLDAELLETKDGKNKNVKGVCAQVLCGEGTVKVKYLGSSGFQPCPEDTEISVTLKDFKKDGKIKCPKYVEVCTIAANGSSLVIPSVLEDDKGEEQEEQVEVSVAAPALSPAEEPHAEAYSPGQPHAESKAQASPAEEPHAEAYSPGQPHEEEPRAAASSTEEPHAQASTAEESHAEASIAEESHAEASIAGKTSEAPVVQTTLQQPQKESKAGQNATVGESANTEHVFVGWNSHAVGESTGDACTVCRSGMLLLLLLLGLWGFAAL